VPAKAGRFVGRVGKCSLAGEHWMCRSAAGGIRCGVRPGGEGQNEETKQESECGDIEKALENCHEDL
jgi:hypothetical protein